MPSRCVHAGRWRNCRRRRTGPRGVARLLSVGKCSSCFSRYCHVQRSIDPVCRRRHFCAGSPAHLFHQVLRPPFAYPPAPCRAIPPAGRSRGGVRLLGDGADPVHGCHGRSGLRHRLPGKPEPDRTAVRVRDPGDGRHAADPAPGPAPGGLDFGSAAAGRAGFLLHHLPDGGAAARLLHHRTGRHDPGRAAAARPFLFPGHFQAPQVRHAGDPAGERLDRRRAHALCGAAGADGGGQVELGPVLHAEQFRLEGGDRGRRQCGRCRHAVPPRAVRAQDPCRRRRQARHAAAGNCHSPAVPAGRGVLQPPPGGVLRPVPVLPGIHRSLQQAPGHR